MKHTVEFRKSGRGKARCLADPDYPHGIEVDGRSSVGQASCKVSLPYPAPECGMWMVNCQTCGLATAISAAGRADDPVSVILPCNVPKQSGPVQ